MRTLRPHLSDAEAFIARVQYQCTQGYALVGWQTHGTLVALAGYRILENLAWGRFLYVDDLVVRSDQQGHGHGQALFRWLVSEARAQGCAQLHLDSGVQRFGAHRFYLAGHMDITSHHFALTL